MNSTIIPRISSQDLTVATAAVKVLYDECSPLFTFPALNQNGLRIQVWSALFDQLRSTSSTVLQTYCLSCIRILSRDKTDLDEIICEKWINVLVDYAGLYRITADEEELLPARTDSQPAVKTEALKCLCNLTFNSPVAQALCASGCAAEGIITRLRTYRPLTLVNDIILYDMKLLFILTALREDVCSKVKGELHGMVYLVECMDEIVKCITSGELLTIPEIRDQSGLIQGGAAFMCNDERQVILCEMLKIEFNLMLKSNKSTDVSKNDDCILIRLMAILNNLLLFTASSEEKKIELHNNVVNFLTSIEDIFYAELINKLSNEESTVSEHFQCEGYNVQSIYVLLRFLHIKLTSSKNVPEQYESLSPILTVLNRAVKSNRVIRIVCRSVILPPLKDVSKPPEEGDSLRSLLCALLTSPITPVRDLVAELLFVLCKEKVGRMVKYTGYGNAAGLLAQKGLLAGGHGVNQYSSSSEDSDTDEYTAARPTLDPITGFCRPPRPNPMEGLSEEQKEYEAMKLVGLLEKLSAQGIVQPARVGPGGRPEPISHLLQLRDEPPQRPQS